MVEGLSVADAIALQERGNDDGFMGGSGIWVILLFILLAGGNGLGGLGGGGATNMINNDFLYTNLARGQEALQMQASNNQRDILTGFHGVDNAVCTIGHQASQNTSSILQNMNQQFAQVDNAVCQLGFQNAQGVSAIQQAIADCCCTTKMEIMQSRFESERQHCATVQAIHADGDATRSLIVQDKIETLRDKLQDARFENSQLAQTAQIITAMQPKMPVPAYPVPSPYGQYGHFNHGCCGNV